jgi:tol-pal system protein YbgF
MGEGDATKHGIAGVSDGGRGGALRMRQRASGEIGGPNRSGGKRDHRIERTTGGAGADEGGARSTGQRGESGIELQPEQRELYDAAYIDFARGEYGLALSGFKAYLERFPSSSLADNAVYWMGECYAADQRWDEAIAQYRLLRERYPEGDKLKSALLKEGMTLLETGRQSEGEAVLRELLQSFPRSEEARVAREQLAQGG